MSTSIALSNEYSTYLAEVERYPLLTPEQEKDLATRYYEQGDIAAAHALVTANLRFVIKVASEYRQYGLRQLDLIQEGNLGLMNAVKKFNPYRGYRLITYAVWWIRAYIQKYIIQNWSLVKIGTTQAQRKLFFKLNQARRALAAGKPEESADANAGALAEALQVSDKDVIEMEMRMSARDFSLDKNLNEEGDSSYLDRLESHEPNQEEFLIDVEEEQLREEGVRNALAQLNDRERIILERRILAEKPATLQEVGDSLKISRERVRQLESGALKKLKGDLCPALCN